jgi:hypothetical protein
MHLTPEEQKRIEKYLKDVETIEDWTLLVKAMVPMLEPHHELLNRILQDRTAAIAKGNGVLELEPMMMILDLARTVGLSLRS